MVRFNDGLIIRYGIIKAVYGKERKLLVNIYDSLLDNNVNVLMNIDDVEIIN